MTELLTLPHFLGYLDALVLTQGESPHASACAPYLHTGEDDDRRKEESLLTECGKTNHAQSVVRWRTKASREARKGFQHRLGLLLTMSFGQESCSRDGDGDGNGERWEVNKRKKRRDQKACG